MSWRIAKKCSAVKELGQWVKEILPTGPNLAGQAIQFDAIDTHFVLTQRIFGWWYAPFSVESDEHEEEIHRFLGKFRACSRANQMVLLNTLDFLAEQLLTLQEDKGENWYAQ